MAFDVSGLTDYVDENRDGLIGSVIAGSKSMRILDLQTGFKFKGAINTLDTDVVFQDGSVCGRTPDGTTVLDQIIMTVAEIKVEEDLCIKSLNKKYTQHSVKAGSKDDVIPFEKEYTDMKVKKINHANEVAIWQGDTGSGTVNLKRFDGFIKLIDAAGDALDGNVSSATAFTPANIIGLVNDMYATIPTELLEAEGGDTDTGDLAVLLGTGLFRMYTLALAADNLFHYDAKSTNMEIMIPATNVKVIALGGLTGTDRMYAGRIGSNGDFTIGTDLEHEEEAFEVWYSKDDKVVKFDVAYKLGTTPKFSNQIVEFTLSV